MTEPVSPDVLVCVCCNCLHDGARLPRQWKKRGVHVMVHEVPCSGKVDAQYLLHAMEGGVRGVCIVTCPKGECQLAQGNYRAQIRVGTIQKLLDEIGLEPQRVELVARTPDKSLTQFEQAIREAADRIGTLGASPLCAGA